jgi:hypothetical protein
MHLWGTPYGCACITQCWCCSRLVQCVWCSRLGVILAESVSSLVVHEEVPQLWQSTQMQRLSHCVLPIKSPPIMSLSLSHVNSCMSCQQLHVSPSDKGTTTGRVPMHATPAVQQHRARCSTALHTTAVPSTWVGQTLHLGDHGRHHATAKTPAATTKVAIAPSAIWDCVSLTRNQAFTSVHNQGGWGHLHCSMQAKRHSLRGHGET